MASRRDYLDARNEEIKELRRTGLTLRAIGEKYGVTREAIRLVCKGIPKPDLKTYHKKKCQQCGKNFVVPSDRKNNKTCSKECFSGIQKYNNYKNGKWTNDLIEFDCAGCGKKFTKTKKLVSIANHSYVARGKDPSEKEWFCSRNCNLNTIHTKREEKKNKESL
jgi:hypothetical protein|tara:strand:- start:489 stop:980 length:492 start_codon:yes stop_codon:yes gene_type:complete